MSHEIETYGDEAAAVFAREDAWHGLGTTLDGAFTAEQAMEVGHLGGWDVRKAPLTALTDDGVIEVPGKYATIRTNPFTHQPEALGVVGKVWEPVQNEEHADVLNTLVDESGAIFDTAGSLLGGRQVFITMKMPQSLMVGGVDRVDLNIVALNNHEGSGSFRLLLSPVRVVCKNTQDAAIAGAVSSFGIRHTSNAKKNIEAARAALGLSFKYIDAFEAEAERMIQQTMDEAAFFEALESNWTSAWTLDKDASDRVKASHKARIDFIGGLFTDAETNDNIRGTRWAAYQAVAEYVDHFTPSKSAEKRAETLVTGTNMRGIKKDAFDLFRVPAKA